MFGESLSQREWRANRRARTKAKCCRQNGHEMVTSVMRLLLKTYVGEVSFNGYLLTYYSFLGQVC